MCLKPAPNVLFSKRFQRYIEPISNLQMLGWLDYLSVFNAGELIG